MKFRRKKNVRQRGSKTHGWGAMKKHRGAGHRGGRGRAGSGKRADQKKPSYWKEKNWEGKHGFTSKTRVMITAINIKDLDATADRLAREGKITKTGNTYEINLPSLGYNKLLATGQTKKAFKVTTPYASAHAAEKVHKTGGELLGLVPKRVRKKPSAEEKPEAKKAKA